MADQVPSTRPEASPTATTARPAAGPDQPGPDRPLGSGPLLVLGLLWLAATMWSAHASIAGDGADGGVVMGSAALALPSVIAASLLAGAAAGLAATSAAGRRAARAEPGLPPPGGPLALGRALLGTAAGALIGLAVAGSVLGGYGASPAMVVLAITVGAAGALGGVAAAVSRPTLAAGIAATLGVFLVGVLLNLFQSPLKSLFGAGETAESRAVAATLLSVTSAGLGGLTAGVIAFGFLRRRNSTATWPAYLLAGAMPGLISLLADGLANIGGARLLDAVGNLSVADRVALDYVDTTRINHALVVGFVGGILAMIMVGRTLGRAGRAPGEPARRTAARPDAG